MSDSTKRKHPRAGAWGLLLGGSLLLGTAAGAQPAPQLAPRAPASKARALLPDGTPVERVVVKFHEGSRVRLRGNALRPLAPERSAAERALLAARGLTDARLADDVKATQALLERAPRAASPRRLFPEHEAVLEARKASGEAQGGRQLADLNLYFEVPLLPGTTAGGVQALVDRLNALDSVEVAYAQPPAEPAMVNFGMDAALRGLLAAADIAPTTPLFESNQGYLNAAPAGIDARYAWTVPGGKGAGVRIVDIEGGWRTTHEDLPTLFHQGGTQINDISWRNHGTAVLGEMVGAANGYGVTGISHEAQAGYESHSGVGVAVAVNRAAAAVGRGGIVLIEAHSPGPADATPCTCNTSQCNYIAMEYWQGEYDAIATATANGVVVVEAAGNGSANLDDAAYGGRFNRSVRDSGAIVVGASQGSSRAPTCWTNYGGRVDVHGWGQSVTTLGYGDLFSSGEDQFYTSSFSGTSSASPVVVGAAASLQGAVLARGLPALSSTALRQLLAQSGTPQGADARNIGPLPDLRRALPLAVESNGALWTSAYSNAAGWASASHYWQTLRFPDLNGDGRDDICGRASNGLHCGLSTGAGFSGPALWTSQYSDPDGWTALDAYWQTLQYADLNGDGRDDVCGRAGDGIYCALSTGVGFGAPSFWTTAYSNAQGWTALEAYWKTIRFPDLNGDGRADVCGRAADGMYCALSTGASFGPSTFWSLAYGNSPWASSASYWETLQFPDLNGDNLDDVCGRGPNGMLCALSTGSSFGAASYWTSAYSDAAGWASANYYWQTLRFPDLNGDGRDDVCGRASNGLHCALSTGVSFGGTSLWTSGYSNPDGWIGLDSYWQTIQYPDINGDGRDDVCGRASGGLYCNLSSGAAFGGAFYWSNAYGDNSGWASDATRWQTIRFQDVNGDGRADACSRAVEGVTCVVK